MAALTRSKVASYELHEEVRVDTEDNEDHTFCGIMFPIKCKDWLPISHLVIRSVAVRGRLGPMTVWVSNDDAFERGEDGSLMQVRLSPRYWTKLYQRTHPPSLRQYQTLELSQPLVMRPGQIRVLYIHSTLPGDEAIVYDNSSYAPNRSVRYQDSMISILTGRAHVSTKAFGQTPIWGWGTAWRDRREFVGRLDYGVVYQLWHPQLYHQFGQKFQNAARLLFACQRKWESPMSRLPDDCIFYILHMCRWDWFEDTPNGMKTNMVAYKQKRASLAMKSESSEEMQVAMLATAEENDQGMSCCKSHEGQCEDATSGQQGNDNDIDDDEDDDEDSEDDMEDDDDDEEDGYWEYENGYRADRNSFSFRDPEADEENNANADDDGDEDDTSTSRFARGSWLRRQMARIHVLRALASMEDVDLTVEDFSDA